MPIALAFLIVLILLVIFVLGVTGQVRRGSQRPEAPARQAEPGGSDHPSEGDKDPS